MQQINLNGTWQLTYGPQVTREPHFAPPAGWPSIAAQVPGNVELDLMAAGVLPDLSVGNNIYKLREYESYEWWYRRSFPTPALQPGQRVELVFEGLDCIATVWLNGKPVGSADNMLIAQRFDVTDLLAMEASETSETPEDFQNELIVRLSSAVLEGHKHQAEPLEAAFAVNTESLNVRKAPHMYGWDIMPRLVSTGIWRDVHLDIIEPTRWRAVYYATLKADPTTRAATLLIDWDFTTDEPSLEGWSIRSHVGRAVSPPPKPDSNHAGAASQATLPILSTHGRTLLILTDVDLWWPRSYGQPTLYNATLELIDATGAVRDTYSCRVGLRTVELRRTDITTPEHPGEFVFVVNGEKAFLHGTNWVPLDALHSRDTQHLKAAMDMIADLNCNMIRCWGGNVYEDHAFFDLCDELGVLVWQDFAMACAIYPQTDDFAARIRQEAESVVTKLRNHPSLALWAGNNEIDESYQWNGLRIDPNTDRLSRQVLPAVVRRLDPARDYLPSSPYRSPELVRLGNDPTFQPEQHLWGPRTDFKGPFYTTSLTHFVSEIGYHGCPDRRTLEQFLEPAYVWPWQDNDQWLTHATRPHPQMTDFNYRIKLMTSQIEVLFDRTPDELDDYVLASQIIQAEAKKFFIEWFRTGKWRRTGILWWNLRDGWPIISDAIVDYYGRKKLAYAYIQRVQTEVCVMVAEPQAGEHAVVAANDTLRPVTGHVRIRNADDDSVLLDADMMIDANYKAIVGYIPQAQSPSMWLIEWTINNGSQHSPEMPMRSHYLAGPRPFKLADYKRWLAKLDLPSDIGSVQVALGK